MGIGLAHSKLRAGRPLDEADIIAYLAHSRATEQRASEQMRSLRRYSAGNADVRRVVTVISADEDSHLAYCHEELLRLVAAGHRRAIESALRTTARAEIAVYRDVSKAVMAHLLTLGARAQACNLVMDPAGDEVLPAVGWVGCLARRETGRARQWRAPGVASALSGEFLPLGQDPALLLKQKGRSPYVRRGSEYPRR